MTDAPVVPRNYYYQYYSSYGDVNKNIVDYGALARCTFWLLPCLNDGSRLGLSFPQSTRN